MTLNALFVVPDQAKARVLEQALDSTKYAVTWFGAPHTGNRFRMIVNLAVIATEQERFWYESQVLTALAPSGIVV